MNGPKERAWITNRCSLFTNAKDKEYAQPDQNPTADCSLPADSQPTTSEFTMHDLPANQPTGEYIASFIWPIMQAKVQHRLFI
jgi:hypothetical protein